MTSGVRRLLLDASPGERRGVVLLDGLPERLLIARDFTPPFAELGARFVGRLGAAAGGRAFVELGLGPPAVGRPPRGATEGAAFEVEVTAEAQGGKGPRVTFGPSAAGPPRRLAPPLPLADRLRVFAPEAEIETGEAARAAADLAEETALEIEHRFRAGLTLHIEPTRALSAIDLDLAAGEGAGERRVKEANLSAIRHAARLLRLKALGGVAALDLIGFPAPDLRGLYRAEAERALAADGAEVAVAPPDRFGLLILSRPRRERPLADVLLAADGRPSAETIARRLARELLREGRSDPGARLLAVGPPEVVAALSPLLPELGPRFGVREVAGDRLGAHIRRA